MPRSTRAAAAAALAALPFAVAVVPATAATPTTSPTVLPAVTKTLTSALSADRTCTATAAQGRRGVATATYRVPMSGFVTATLKGAGDWDLLLKDADTGRTLQASQGFGGDELTQAWVAAGQRLTVLGCRQPGAAKRAKVTFRLTDVTPPKSLGAPRLVRVTAGRTAVEKLEELGFDVTHNVKRGYADLVVTGADELAALKATGLKLTTRVKDLTKNYAKARRADARFAARAAAADGSGLPSGRTGYRQYADYQAEMKALVEQHPGLVRPVTFGKTYQGREITGVEIAKDVNATDGRPVSFTVGVHHAREWPAGEAAMEFATLLAKDASDPRIAELLKTTRVVVLPVLNIDGYLVSRSSFSVADSVLDQNPNATLVEAVAPPGGFGAYRRKNCDGEITPPTFPCELAWGVDNNRNYGNLWGGPGSSSDVTSQSYHGPGPRSEPETQALWDYTRTHHVTGLVSIHTVAALVLRPPGLAQLGLAPDEPRLKEVGDAMAKAAGYTSQFSWQLYDTAGTTEDDTYAATGGYGYTIEMGPPDGEFHEPYETGVVKEWTGENEHAKGAGGMREALLIAAESAATPKDHAVFAGTAPAGKVLRLKKAFKTKTSPFCEKGIEPLLNVDALPNGGSVCLGAEQDPITLDDTIDTTTTVPASGTFEWHIGQSTAPFVGGGARLEQTEDVDPPLATIEGAPGAPQGTVDHEVVVPAGEAADKLRFRLTSTLPEDYDIEVFRKDGDTLTPVGSSGNVPGSPEEVLTNDATPGTYVVRVMFYLAATGAYEIKATRVRTTHTVTTGTKESYVLTCEEPDGTVKETLALQIDRGQQATARLGCGTAPSAVTQTGRDVPLAEGATITGIPQTAASAGPGTRPTTGGGASGTPGKPRKRTLALSAKRSLKVSRGVRVGIACPKAVGSACRGAVSLRGVTTGKKTRTLASRAFRVAAGKRTTVTLKLTKSARSALRTKGRLKARLVASGTAGTTALAGSRSITLRRR